MNAAKVLLEMTHLTTPVRESIDPHTDLEDGSKHVERSKEPSPDANVVDLSIYYAQRASTISYWLQGQINMIESLRPADLDPEDRAALDGFSKAFEWEKATLTVTQKKISKLRNAKSRSEKRGLIGALVTELSEQSKELRTEAAKFTKLCVALLEYLEAPGLELFVERNTRLIDESYHGARGIEEENEEQNSLQRPPEQQSGDSHKSEDEHKGLVASRASIMEENVKMIDDLFRMAKEIEKNKLETKTLALALQESGQSHKATEVQTQSHSVAVDDAQFLLTKINSMISHTQETKKLGHTPQGIAVLDAAIKRMTEMRNGVEADVNKIKRRGSADSKTAQLKALAALSEKLSRISRQLSMDWEKIKAEKSYQEGRSTEASTQGHQLTESTTIQDTANTEPIAKPRKKTKKKKKPKKKTGTAAATTAVGTPSSEVDRARALSLASGSTILGDGNANPHTPTSDTPSSPPPDPTATPATPAVEPSLKSFIDDYYDKKERGWDYLKMLAFEQPRISKKRGARTSG